MNIYLLYSLIRKYNDLKNNKEFTRNESQISESLIKPFVNLVLGYDTSDPSDFKVQSSMGGKRSDMLVCLNGVTQFIIEAKALSHDIRKDYQYYQQAIYYAHTKEKKFAILTNFKHFIILDAEIEKEPLKAEVALVDIEKYEENFDILWAFSKEVWQQKGEDNEILLKLKGKKKQKIDEQLLDDLKRWRELLLNSLKKHPQKNKYDFEKDIGKIEEEVQKFIDRLVFICYCEDKKLMDVELNPIINDKDRFWDKEWYALDRVRKLFEVYFQKYNSDLFNESWCDKFYFDDNTLLKVLKDLRQPKGKQPYDFSIIEADILGKAYENFIGHVITGQKRFKEKESKGKRKSEGIYYTPTYIVDYIVRNTISEYIKGKSIASINKVKILDPACGSGSFLIKAFDSLVEECEKIRKLTYDEKKDLMLNCIFGVDKDERAVDICKLNLSLKLAERGEKLPELHNNIKCGDSLIDDENVADTKAFKWEEQFKEIMDNGGFDVVIGNPPYVDIKRMQDEESDYFKKRYIGAYRRFDLYVIFLNKGISLIKNGGMLGFIVPEKFMTLPYGEKIREKILQECLIKEIVDLSSFKIFQATVKNILVFLKKEENHIARSKNVMNIVNIPNEYSLSNISNGKIIHIVQHLFSETPNKTFRLNIGSNSLSIINKIKKQSFNLEKIAYVSYGAQTGIMKNFIFDKKLNSLCKPFIKGTNVNRYSIKYEGKFILYDIKKLHRPAFKELFETEKIVVCQVCGEKGIKASLDEEHFYSDVTTDLCILKYSLLEVPPDIIKARGILIDKNEIDFSKRFQIKYLLGLINSKLINFYFKSYIGDGLHTHPNDVKIFPIFDANDKEQARLSLFVNKMLSLNKKLQEIGDKNTLEKQKIEQEIKKTDN